MLRRVAPRIPGALVALVVGIVLSTAARPARARASPSSARWPTGIPFPSIPNIPFGDIVFLITGAFGIVFLALAESIGAARSFGARHGYDIDPNQELIALGAANAARRPVRRVLGRRQLQPVGDRRGGRQPDPAVVAHHGRPRSSRPRSSWPRSSPTCRCPSWPRSSSPRCSAWSNIAELRRYLAWKRTDFLLAMTALGGVVFTTALTGMAIAVALSLLAILYQASRPYIAVLGRIPGDRRSSPTRAPRPCRAGRRVPASSARTSR